MTNSTAYFLQTMTSDLRDLLIALSSHMAYMQGQLQAHHEYDDPEDFYWYRESVILRQRAAEAINQLISDSEPAT